MFRPVGTAFCRTIDTDTTLDKHDELVLVQAAGPVTVTLPARPARGRSYVIKRIGAGLVTLLPAAGQIDGAASYILAGNNEWARIAWDGANWWITG